MQDVLLAIAVLVFVCLGFPAMKRLDRFLSARLKKEEERPETDARPAGKKRSKML